MKLRKLTKIKRFDVGTVVYRNEPDNYYHNFKGIVEAISVFNPKNRLVKWQDNTRRWIHIKYLKMRSND